MKAASKLEKKLPRHKENMITLAARGRRIAFPRRPLIMGILNITDDSFSGDGRLDPAWALARARELVAAGADIIDVGGESARTNRAAVPPEEEWRRMGPFIEGFVEAVRDGSPRDAEQVYPPLLSANTWRPEVAERALAAGAELLNDMGALPDDKNARLCAASGAALLIMHSQGEPKVAHTHVAYDDVITEMRRFFSEKIELALRAGVAREQILLDPGIDFAKQTEDNLRVYRELEAFAEFGRPILLPVSRKSVIGRVLGITDPAARDAGTVACLVAGALRGASIFRVHNVDAAWLALRALGEVA